VDQFAQRLIELVSQQDNMLGLAIVGLAAFLEYVFPPVPGDLLVLSSGTLVGTHGWSFASLFASVLVGSAFGSLAAWYLGVLIRRRELRTPVRHPQIRAQVDQLVLRFQRHGEVLLAINRFVPAVRSLFFVAAGMAGMRPRWVLTWAMVSATMWNLLLLSVGTVVGENLGILRAFFKTYSRWAWIAVGTALFLWLTRYAIKRWKAPSRKKEHTG
jgi:membrane protein DedA with SNARE-associated domain